MKSKPFLIVGLVLALVLLLVTPASAFFAPTDGQAATLVLGQLDFTSNAASTTQSGMQLPVDVVVDPTTGKVFVADTINNRVLRFDSVAALSDGAPAEAVLGQLNFTSSGQIFGTQNGMSHPDGLAVDGSGRLWVADGFNNRVLRFDNAAAKANGANADGVLGQPDFTSDACNTMQDGMCWPAGLAVDASGRLWVADGMNSRVLRFDNAAAKANGANADGVLGKPNFTSNACNITQSEMCIPPNVAVDASGRLWVADNWRVLRFDNAAAKANGANADGVLGQPDFTTAARGTSQSRMNFPDGVATDTSGRLYVSDGNNNRVLVFDAAASLPNGANASYVLGQTNFTDEACNNGGISDATLCEPGGLFFDPSAKVLWLADSLNARVLMYGQPDAILHISPIIGLIVDFLPPGTTVEGKISIRVQDGSIHTFDVPPNVRILPSKRAADLKAGSFVTLLTQFNRATGHVVVLQIIVHPTVASP